MEWIVKFSPGSMSEVKQNVFLKVWGGQLPQGMDWLSTACTPIAAPLQLLPTILEKVSSAAASAHGGSL